MHFLKVVTGLLASNALIRGAVLDVGKPARIGLDRKMVARQADLTRLNADALQTASSRTGQEDGTDGIKPGQAPSAT